MSPPPVRVVKLTIAATAIARIVLALTVGLGVDESYAASVAHPLALSYFDHPPLHFWIAAAAELPQGASPLADLVVRLPFIALFALTTWLMYIVTARVFDQRAGMYAVLVLNVIPVFSVSTGSWVLPDGPLMCAWLAAVYCVVRADDSPYWWLGAGIATGLAMLSKYHGVLLMGGIFIYLLIAARHWLVRPWPYIAAVLAVSLFTPVIVWNAEHHWVSFAFQLGRNAESQASPWLALARNVGGQVGIVTPWMWVPLLLALVRVRSPLFVTLGVIPIALFTVVSLGGNPGQPHWAAPGYLMLVPLLGRLASSWPTQRVRLWLVASGGLLACTAATVALVKPIDDLIDWRGLQVPAPGQFVAAPSWIQAGKVSWSLGPAIPVVCLCVSPHEFAFRQDQHALLGRDALIMLRPKTAGQMIPRYEPYFESIRLLREIAIGNSRVRVLVYLAHDFQRPFPR